MSTGRDSEHHPRRDGLGRRGATAMVESAAWVPPPDLLLAITSSLPEASAIAGDDEGAIVLRWANPAFESLLGYEPGTTLGRGLEMLDARLLTAAAPNCGAPALLDPDARPMDVSLRRADGSSLQARVRVTRLQSMGRSFLLLTVSEITAHLRATERLRAAEERFHVLTTQAHVGVFFSEVGVRLGYVNDRMADVWGRSPAELLGTGWLAGLAESDRPVVLDRISQVLAGEEIDVEVRVERPDGTCRWARLSAAPAQRPGQAAGFVGSVEDVTVVRTHEQELSYQASHDPLTGLPNRTLLWTRLREVLEGPVRARSVALFSLDLDDFKLVTDSLGHAVGDELLVQVARRLEAAVRPSDLVIRLGGDEFVVMAVDIADDVEAVDMAARVLGTLRSPFLVHGREIPVSASVGVVRGRAGQEGAAGLVRDADVAMYQAKTSGKARVCLFDPRAREGMEERLALVSDLRRAVQEAGLWIAYQPIVHLEQATVVGAEALVRWRHRTRGEISAPELISLAEETGVIADLGAWVIGEACAQMAEWQAQLGDAAPSSIAVNLSGHQLTHNALVPTVEEALERSGIHPSVLCLELTESVLMSDIDAALGVLEQLKLLGVRLAVDDFGTGYSSLAYLRRFPVDVLKVDRSFVLGLPEDESNRAIVSAVVGLAEAMNLGMVAEGVETEVQRAALVELGCELAQGYLFGRPVPSRAFTDMLVAMTSPRVAS